VTQWPGAGHKSSASVASTHDSNALCTRTHCKTNQNVSIPACTVTTATSFSLPLILFQLLVTGGHFAFDHTMLDMIFDMSPSLITRFASSFPTPGTWNIAPLVMDWWHWDLLILTTYRPTARICESCASRIINWIVISRILTRTNFRPNIFTETVWKGLKISRPFSGTVEQSVGCVCLCLCVWPINF